MADQYLMHPDSKVVCAHVTSTIANNGTASTSVKTAGFRYGAYLVPSGFTGTALTFQGSEDDSTFADINDSASTPAIVQHTLGAGTKGEWILLPDACMRHAYLKCTSGSAEGAERTIKWSFKS